MNIDVKTKRIKTPSFRRNFIRLERIADRSLLIPDSYARRRRRPTSKSIATNHGRKPKTFNSRKTTSHFEVEIPHGERDNAHEP